MKKYPNVTQKVLFKCNNAVMVMKHKNGIFDFPGGRMEWLEDMLGSLNRELKEELDYSIMAMPELFHVWNYISKDKKRHSLMVYYICLLKKRPKLVSPEKMEILWVDEIAMNDIIKDKSFVRKIYSHT